MAITDTYRQVPEKGGEALMEKKLYYTAKEVSEILGISVSHNGDDLIQVITDYQ